MRRTPTQHHTAEAAPHQRSWEEEGGQSPHQVYKTQEGNAIAPKFDVGLKLLEIIWRSLEGVFMYYRRLMNWPNLT